MQHARRLDQEDDDALTDLDSDLFGEHSGVFYSRRAGRRNWKRRIVLLVALLAAAFLVLAVVGIHL
jgi:type IV secretory pathway component VirB8